MSGTERITSLELYCGDCDVLSVTHRRDEDQWVCTRCENIKECGNPQWSDNCDGDLITVHEVRKGMCEGCLSVIDSWSDEDGDEDETSEQATLMTDGGQDEDGMEQRGEENDDWSAQSVIWGEEFCITIRTEGIEAVGNVPHFRVYHAIEEYLLTQDHHFEPGDRPESPDELPAMPRENKRYSIGEAVITLWLDAPTDLAEKELSELTEIAADAIPVEYEVVA